MSGFEHIVSVVKTLIGENGCPWDKAQTPLSLRRFLVEECFEAVDAISQNDAAHAKEELGDVFFNVIFDALLYEKKGDFSLDECLHDAAEKLERRHPHIFADSAGKSQENPDIELQWEKIKKNVEGRNLDSFSDIPLSFPPLLRSSKLISRAEKRGLAKNSAQSAKNKIKQELDGILDALDKIGQEEKIGEMLFAVSSLAFALGVDPTVALSQANAKFVKQFSAEDSETSSE